MKANKCSYTSAYQDFVNTKEVTVIEEPVDFDTTHTKVVEPYITEICKNISNRFGDSAGSVSIAASVFDSMSCQYIAREQQLKYIQQLSKFFNLNEDDTVAEWNLFRSTLLHKKNEKKTAAEMFHLLYNI
jgi:hypothetical protein